MLLFLVIYLTAHTEITKNLTEKTLEVPGLFMILAFTEMNGNFNISLNFVPKVLIDDTPVINDSCNQWLGAA